MRLSDAELVRLMGKTTFRRYRIAIKQEMPSSNAIAEMFGVSLATAKRDRQAVLFALGKK